MPLILLIAVALTTVACTRQTQSAADARYVHQGEVAGVATGIRLISPLPNGEWHLPSGDYAGTRFSPLSQIDTTNVAGLKVVTTMSTGVPRGHEGQPLVVGDRMYVVTPFPNYVYAIDLSKPGGERLWTFDPKADPRAVGIACCDVVNRGASYADGKIIFATLDAQAIAVDAATGAEVWRTKVGNIMVGETITMAPLVVKDRVIVGSSGGELGVRGFVVALDLGSGREIWRAFHTGPDRETLIGPQFKPFYGDLRQPDLGVSTWPADKWQTGGATCGAGSRTIRHST